MNSLTIKEEEAILKLREKIDDVYNELDDFHKHDLSLLRFLRARDLNVTKAEEMLRNNIKWRKENNVDKVMGTEHSQSLGIRFPFKISGYDSDGSYISVIPVGRYDYRAVIENGEKDDFRHYMIKTSELAYELCKYKSTKDNFVTTAVIIVDYEAFNGIRILTSPETIQFMKELMVIMEANYPELLKACWVVNAPKVFEVVFALMKPLLTKAMLEKIHVFGSNSTSWKEALLKTIHPDQLPSKYGGSNTSIQNYKFEYGLDVSPNLPNLPEEMKTETVPAGQKFQIDIPITVQGTELQWNFKVDDYDLGFSLHFDGEGRTEELISCPKCDAHLNVQKGKFVCSKPGKYILCFDNSYSKFRSKTLHYVYKKLETSN